MKVKTSVTLSEDIIKIIDKRISDFKNRSDFIEHAIRSYIEKLKKDEQNAKDLAILNKEADRLNKEAEDVLSYQVIP
ncbi:MAG: ribbon-helix-helix protein, CopG family [Candidatus Dadabacteria bacterium]|nr:ribbon-helix-helix protein, CopG family [Candidatus Dadabacteria bacterium]NIS09139.1 ribbon-helix-helix protein, CopG family [Candidatus Dadabacteria bacterium]NIY22446.1 ribbon-helix-helix protein, CopG family [Candidatus Dadabacteria bacterium]